MFSGGNRQDHVFSEEQSVSQDSSNSSFTNLQVDYVIVFSLLPLNKEKVLDKAAHAKELLEEYNLLIDRLKTVGLSATGRLGAKGTHEVLILVTAHDETRIKEEIHAERLADWLHGITFVKPQPGLSNCFLSQPYTAAERLRHLYDIITRDAKPPSIPASPLSAHPSRPLIGSGAGVIPRHAPFYHVKSIFPPHDLAFNKLWLSSWSDRSHLSIKIPDVELDQIKEIYGESIGYYFAFLNFYFQALIFPAGLGFLFWITKLKYSFTYSVILVLWSLIFIETWQIKERLLAIRWNSFNCHKVEKKRVEFKPQKTVRDFVTNEPIGYFPWWKRELRKLVTIPVLILFTIGLCALITVITAMELITAEVYKGPFKKALALLPTVLFAASVPQLVKLWQSTAIKLSNWENHSYNSSYDRSLTHKTFIAHGLVAYAGLVLTAFVYVPFGAVLVPKLASHFQKFIETNPISSEGLADSKLNTQTFDFSTYTINTSRLYEQLFAYQVTNQLMDTFTEVGLPYLMKIASFKWNKILDNRHQHKQKTCSPSMGISPKFIDSVDERELLERLREEARLPDYRLFVEYAEMAIQFGFVVLWTVIWPISPVFSFVNNFFELRTDAIKLIKHSRRPVPTRCDSIGPWLDVLKALVWLGVIINAALVYLFKSSNHVLEPSLDSLNSSSKKHQTLTRTSHVADLFAAALSKTKGNQCESKALNDGMFDRLSSILLSALIPMLISEHVFFVIRHMVREVIQRLLWKNSEAEVKQRKTDWELKQSFVEQLDQYQNNRDTSSEAMNFFPFRKVEIHKKDEEFWLRDDSGAQEIKLLGKTE
ncbi:hypothetical protein O181_032273 [Austropuccinia psidii MF-1]|uniref:Uncharacterized protein n=1 Tax=Austropuccinia psidii MF-1 TaxID=1389203 RepID=A0A9Q3CZ53_9BASI|nr:hypothetical protein [Austropuccinia psidii MF-1]